MLSETLFRVSAGNRPADAAAARRARRARADQFAAVPAGRRQRRYVCPDEETVVVLQEGRGTFATPDASWPVTRTNVFADRATALYLPPECRSSSRPSPSSKPSWYRRRRPSPAGRAPGQTTSR